MKLRLLKSILLTLESSDVICNQQLGILVSSFISYLDETNENLELELVVVLCIVGVVRSVDNAAFLESAPVVIAFVGSSWAIGCDLEGMNKMAQCVALGCIIFLNKLLFCNNVVPRICELCVIIVCVMPITCKRYRSRCEVSHFGRF